MSNTSPARQFLDQVVAELKQYVVQLPDDGYAVEGLQSVYDTKRKVQSYLYRVEELMATAHSQRSVARGSARLGELGVEFATATFLIQQNPTMLSSRGYAFEERRAMAIIATKNIRGKVHHLQIDLDMLQEACRILEVRHRTLADLARSLDGVTQLVRLGHSIGEMH